MTDPGVNKKVLLLTPDWGHPWQGIFTKLYAEKGYEVIISSKDKPELNPAIVLHMWATGDTKPELYPDSVNIMYMRRYELVGSHWQKIQWEHVDVLIFVNKFIKCVVDDFFKNNDIQINTKLIYNAVDLDNWTWKDRIPNKKIGMVCSVHPKKNIALAMQILAELPLEYELHLIGDVQDAFMFEYLNHMGRSIKRQVFIYQAIPNKALDIWWEDKSFCLSTSMSEGNPNNVLEALAKGIKPIVHNWMGAKKQFSPFVFNTVREAVDLILKGSYNSNEYLDLSKTKFSINNYKKVVNLSLEL